MESTQAGKGLYIAQTGHWYLERVIWLVAGTITLVSVSLSVLVSPYWLILTALVGVNLLLFAFTGFCIMANVLVRLGFRPQAG